MKSMRTFLRSSRLHVALVVVAFSAIAGPAGAQAPASGEAPSAAARPAGLAALGWLAGCWQGAVNLREFREQWTPLRGGVMAGVGHTVMGEKTQSIEYLRLESRPDGDYYVVAPVGESPAAFRLAGMTRDGDDEIFTFANRADVFPQTVIYRRGAKGWLYAHAEGKVDGAERRVIYPMRRVDCETGETIEK